MDSNATTRSSVRSITKKLKKLKKLSHMTPPNTQSSRLFSLPRELRDLIFAQVFKPQDNKDIDNEVKIPRVRPINVLTVNRQFHDEAIACLQRTKWIKINWWMGRFWTSEVEALPKLLALPRTVPPALEIDITEIESIPRREKWRTRRDTVGEEPGRAVWAVNEEGLKHFMRCLWHFHTRPRHDASRITLHFHSQDPTTQTRISSILFNAPPFKEQSITGLLDNKLQTELVRQFKLPRHDKRRRCQALFIHGFDSKGDAAYARGDFELAVNYYNQLFEYMSACPRHWNSGEAHRRLLEGSVKLCKASVRTGKPFLAIRKANRVLKQLAELRSYGKHPELWRLSKLQHAKLYLCMARARWLGEPDASNGTSKFLQAQEVLYNIGLPHQPPCSKDVQDFVRFAYEIADGCEEWTKLITDQFSELSLEDEAEEDDSVSEIVSESTSTNDSDDSSDSDN
ncbi:hypothetical protein MMC27_008142 [Xylographa pallens]|nr:hypothetical protein [Xylographa pallens]